MKIINVVEKYKMKYKTPKNPNYCATVVKLDKFVELQNCDNVKHALILGNSVIVDKFALVGSMGLYFPVETKLSVEFLSENNLYRNNLLNVNKQEKGYFEESGRIKCMKFRGHKSEGFYIPLISLSKFVGKLDLASMRVGDEFDEINGINICEKYVIVSNNPYSKGSGTVEKRISRIIDEQFRLYVDTVNLRKNIFAVNPTDIISLTYKMHGTSFTVANILTKPKMKWYDKIINAILNIAPAPIYDIVYSSRRVVKNEFETKDNKHYYKYDLWEEIKNKVSHGIEKGITLYGEAVGYLKDGGYIQRGYDYKCAPNEFEAYIYRITYTNVDGKVIEFTFGQLKDYCKKYALKHVPELYYGRAGLLFPISENTFWHETFLKMLEERYLEKKCNMCENDVPAEGIVLKVDKTFDCEPYKLKSFAFLERETKELDNQVVDIESEQS